MAILKLSRLAYLIVLVLSFSCQKTVVKTYDNDDCDVYAAGKKGFWIDIYSKSLKENEIEFFTQILKKINTSQYAETRKFVKKRKRNGKRIYVPRIQELKQLQPCEYSGPHSILNDEERRYFACIQVYDPKTKRFKGIYEFLQPWRFRLIIKPNMITHYKPLDIDLKREEAQIDHFFDKYKNQGILLKKIVGGGYSYERKPKFKNPFTKRKFFNDKNSATEIAEMLIEQEHQLSKRH